MNRTGGGHYIDAGSNAYAAGSKVAEIHTDLIISVAIGNLVQAFPCTTFIGFVARSGAVYNAHEAIGEGIISAANIYYDPEHASGWEYLNVAIAVAEVIGLGSMGGCFVVDTPVAVGWGEYHANVMPEVPGPDDDWSVTWLSLGAGCLVTAVTIRRRRRQRDEEEEQDRDHLFARWNGDEEPIESVPFSIDPPDQFSNTEENDAPGIEANAAISGLDGDSYNDAERNDRMLPHPAIPEWTATRRRPRSLREEQSRSWLAGWATAFLLVLAGLCLQQAVPRSTPSTASVAQASVPPVGSKLYNPLNTRRLVTKPIQSIELGDRVIVSLPAAALLPMEPAEALPDQWLEYPADDTLPVGVKFKVSNGVIVDVANLPSSSTTASDILGTRYVVGDVDATDITPALCRAVSLEMTKADGSLADLSLLRPLWWLDRMRTKPGSTIDLSVGEIGLAGSARVLGIGACTADSRSISKSEELVTGRVRHRDMQAFDLTFDGESIHSLGVTANHPIFSHDREEWVPAGDLRVGETVNTACGTATLLDRVARPQAEMVFNLEVHRSHAYRVSKSNILVHNATAGLCPTATPPRTNGQLVQDIATRAENKIGGIGALAGTLKHSYADRLLTRYQSMFGTRGLRTETSWIRGAGKPYGTKASVRIDVLDQAAGTAYDYKFVISPPGLSATRAQKIMTNGPGISVVVEVNP